MPLLNKCPECHQAIDVSDMALFSKIRCPACDSVIRVRSQLGRFQILRRLGEGGMSTVYYAYDATLDRKVALKVMNQRLSGDKALMSMFDREAKLTAAINHPNVIKVYNVGEDQGHFYIGMELVDADNLESVISKHPKGIPEDQVSKICREMASGLQAAYRENLIHRDIKPGNILLTKAGVSKLVDFGLALHQGGSDESEEMWATPYYVPPEKLDDQPDTVIGDIYSLGATFFHLLAGRPPFEADTSSIERLKVIKREQVSLRKACPHLKPGLAQLVDDMMAYKPANRPQSYGDILHRLDLIRTNPNAGCEKKRSSRKPLLIFAWAMAAALVVVVALLAVLRSTSDFSGPDGFSQDVVIDSGDRVRSYVLKRNMLGDGRIQNGRIQLRNYANDGKNPASLRINASYLAGIAALALGEQNAANAHFDTVGSIENTESDTRAQFLQKVAPELSGDMAMLADDVASESMTYEKIHILAAALKNWNLGDIANTKTLFSRFYRAPFQASEGWLKDLGEQVKEIPRAIADFERTNAASRSVGPETLEKIRDNYDSILTRLREKELALPDSFVSQVKKERREVAEAIQQFEETESNGGQFFGRGADQSATVSLLEPPTDKELREQLESLRQLASTLRKGNQERRRLIFEDSIQRFQSLSVEGAHASAIRNSLIHAHREAENHLEIAKARIEGRTQRGVEIPMRPRSELKGSVRWDEKASQFVAKTEKGETVVLESRELLTRWFGEIFWQEWKKDLGSFKQALPSLAFYFLVTGSPTLAEEVAASVGQEDTAFHSHWQTVISLRDYLRSAEALTGSE